MVFVDYIAVSGGFVLLSDDSVCQIINMLDDDGEYTDEVDEVEAIVFEAPDGRLIGMSMAAVPDVIIN